MDDSYILVYCVYSYGLCVRREFFVSGCTVCEIYRLYTPGELCGCGSYDVDMNNKSLLWVLIVYKKCIVCLSIYSSVALVTTLVSVDKYSENVGD